MDLTVADFDRICRVCLSESDEMVPLIQKNKSRGRKQQSLMDMMAFTACITVKIDDNLPKQVCSNCETLIISAAEFKRRCTESNTILNNVYKANININVTSYGAKIEANDSKQTLDIIKNSSNDSQIMFTKKETIFSDLGEKKDFMCSDSSSFGMDVKMELSDSLNMQPVEVEFGNDFDNRDELEVNEWPEDINYLKKESINKKFSLYTCSCNQVFYSKKECTAHMIEGKCKPSKKKNRKKTENIKTNGESSENKETNECDDLAINEENVEMWKNQLEIMESKTENEFKYKCPLCERKFKSKKTLVPHLKRHEQDNIRHTCDKCKRQFKYKAFLDSHILSVHMEHSFVCEFCMEKFNTKESLEVHRDLHKTEKKHQCSMCNKAFQMLCTLRDHMRTHTGEKPFLCSVCGKGFSQKNNMLQHMKRHLGMKPYKCESCEKGFVSKGELESHARKHSGAHPFVCPECNNGFTTSSALLKHRRTHTGERPYCCDLCPMRFAASSTLKNHRRTHTGERPYQCSHCEKAFVQRTDLISHIRCHTGERPYCCPQCGQAFRMSSALKVHVRAHGREHLSILP